MKIKVVIANSVGKDSEGYYLVHSPSRWSVGWKDYREVFTYYPWELAYLSSILKQSGNYDVRFMDGCLNKWDGEQYYAAIAAHGPDWLVMESSSRSYTEDIKLAKKVKKHFGTRLIFCGQHPSAFPEEVIKHADFVCIGEYEETVLELISGKDPESILGLYPNAHRPLLDINSLPYPEDSDVKRIEYAVPGEPNCEYKEIQIYASRGCPFSCRFCVCSNIYYNKPNWRPRKISSIVGEIKALKEKYPEVEGFFFDEELHNGTKEFVMSLTKAIKDSGLNTLRYNAMCAYWNLDRDMIYAFKEAGYYKIRIGIETASKKTADGMGLGKKHSIKKLYDVLNTAKEVGLKVYGTFTVGGETSTTREDQKTGELVEKLVSEGLLNDIQVSINTPQPGTPFFVEAEKNSWLLTKDWKKYDGGNFSVVSYPWYNNTEIKKSFKNILTCYDRGLYARKRDGFGKNFEKLLNDLRVKGKSGPFLICRCARMWHIRLMLDSLVFTDVDILAQREVSPELGDLGNVRNVYEYGSGFFMYSKLSGDIHSQLKDSEFSAVLIPSSSYGKEGYNEWQKLVKTLPNAASVFVFPDGSGEIF